MSDGGALNVCWYVLGSYIPNFLHLIVHIFLEGTCLYSLGVPSQQYTMS